MAPKSKYVGIRVEPKTIEKLIKLSIAAGDPGNMSAGLRYALDMIKIEGVITTIMVDVPTSDKKGL